MRLFQCQFCRQPLYFENTSCESCGRRLGYLPQEQTVSALEPEGDLWRALAAPEGHFRLCSNARYDVCNWLVAAGSEGPFCAACRHNRTIPDLSIPQNRLRWRRIEFAKHRLFYTLLKLDLPLATRSEDPGHGLAFDFLSDAAEPVTTGHASGVITLKLSEADDDARERERASMGEPYRTLLGHFRHEIAHYYWDRLVAPPSPALDAFRATFGDERQDYAAALQRNYNQGPPADWPENFVSAYASAHPWEDFAETFAHYFHIVDTLETAQSFGLSVRPQVEKSSDLAARIDFDPHHAAMERIIEAWLPLTFAMNSINRSMGQPDLYPFVLAPPVIVKLGFIHGLIQQGTPRSRS